MKCDRRRFPADGRVVRCNCREGLTRFTDDQFHAIDLCLEHWHLADTPESFMTVWNASGKKMEYPPLPAPQVVFATPFP